MLIKTIKHNGTIWEAHLHPPREPVRGTQLELLFIPHTLEAQAAAAYVCTPTEALFAKRMKPHPDDALLGTLLQEAIDHDRSFAVPYGALR